MPRAIALPSAPQTFGPPDFWVPLTKTGPGRRCFILKSHNRAVCRPGPRRKGRPCGCTPGMIKSPDYRRWADYARGKLIRQREGLGWTMPDPCAALLVVACLVPANRSGLPDLDGFVATALDLAQHAGLIDNDRQARRTDYSEILPPNPEAPGVAWWIRRLTPTQERGGDRFFWMAGKEPDARA